MHTPPLPSSNPSGWRMYTSSWSVLYRNAIFISNWCNCKHSTYCVIACHRPEGLIVIDACLLHVSFHNQSRAKPFCQTISIQLLSKHQTAVDDLDILRTLSQLPRVVIHQCIHFFLLGRNPLLLLRGVHSFLVWSWISTTSNSSACQQKNVVPWCHPLWPLARAYWSSCVPLKLFLGLLLEDFLPLWRLRQCVIFLPLLRNHIFHSCIFQPRFNHLTGANSFWLEVDKRMHSLVARWHINLVPVFIIQVTNHSTKHALVVEFLLKLLWDVYITLHAKHT